MRSLRHADVIAAARVVLGVPEHRRATLCACLLRQADWADRFTRRLGKPHPAWGNGTLLGAASAWPMMAEPTFDDPAYRAAFMLVLTQVDACKTPGDL